jgi:syntaxin-binding protein 1
MDLFAPLIHEFTYQAMVHELLPIQDGDRTYYIPPSDGDPQKQDQRPVELGENDRIWVENRHLHMKDLLEKLVADFSRFRADNPQFFDAYDRTTFLLGH